MALSRGMELVVQAGNGRRVQVRRARPRQWTPRLEQRFLQALSATCNVRRAAAEAGMSAPSAYRHRKLWPNFASAWGRAIQIGYLRLEAALIESGIRFLEMEPVPDDAIVRTMSVAEAIQALNMNKFAVNGIGKRPGVRWRPPPSLNDPMPACATN